MLTDLGASAVVVRSQQILLIKREDSDAWGLPTGQLESGESVAQTAMREVYEETGIQVQLTHLVGIYSMPKWTNIGTHVVVFKAKPIGGVLTTQKGETTEAGYFDPDQLPEPLIWWHRQRIRDALNDVGGSVAWRQNVELSVPRAQLYELYERSGLSKAEFFMRYFGQPQLGDETLEVGSIDML